MNKMYSLYHPYLPEGVAGVVTLIESKDAIIYLGLGTYIF